MQTIPAKTLERFWAKVDKSSDCWEWTASKKAFGHGQFNLPGGKCALAHRISYELANGPIPQGLSIDHICHNPSCVNPSHLRAVTHKQNLENQRGANASSKSGIRGVSWSKRSNKWHVHVKHNRVNVWGGGYATLAEAEVAAIDLRNRLFTCNDADRVAA